MSIYHRLPPISRTPSPPARNARRHHSFGGELSVLPEDDDDSNWKDTTDAGPSSASAVAAPAAPPAARKKRKAKKRFLTLGKDPNGKWKKRRLLKEEQEIQKALELTVADSESDADMLESINVAGGFLLIGEGSANPRPQEPKRKKVVTVKKRGKPRSHGRIPPGVLETKISQPKPKAFVKGPMRFPSVSPCPSDREDEEATIIGTEDPKALGHDIAPAREPTVSISPTTERQSSQPAPPEPPPLLQPSSSPLPLDLGGAASLLTFYIYKFPDLETSWEISGRELCSPDVKSRPSWSILTLLIQRKLASVINSVTQRVLLNWSFTLANQAQLDAAIDELLAHGRAAHDIVLVDLDDRGKLPWKVEEMAARLEGEGGGAFWKGQGKRGIPQGIVEAADKREAMISKSEPVLLAELATPARRAGGKSASVSTSDTVSPRPSSPITHQSSSQPPTLPAPPPIPTAAKLPSRAPALTSALLRTKRKLSEFLAPPIKTASARPSTTPSPSTRSRAVSSLVSRWRSGGGVEAGTQTVGTSADDLLSVQNIGAGPRKKKTPPVVPVTPVGGKVTLADALKRQQELRDGNKAAEKGKEKGEEIDKTSPKTTREPSEPRDIDKESEKESENEKEKKNENSDDMFALSPLPPPPPPSPPKTQEPSVVAKAITLKETTDSALRAALAAGSQSPPKRLPSPPKRSQSPPKRSQSPPKRSQSPPKRSQSPPKRSQSPPKRSQSPPNRLQEKSKESLSHEPTSASASASVPTPAPPVAGGAVIGNASVLHISTLPLPPQTLTHALPEPTPQAPEPTLQAPEPTPQTPEPTPQAPEPTPQAPEPAPQAPAPAPQAPAPKEPTREERFKAVVAEAVAAAANNDGAESRIGNYQRAARSGNDALKAVAERRLETAAADGRISVDLGSATQDIGLYELEEDSGSAYTPSMSRSMSISTGTDTEKEVRLPSEEEDQLYVRQSVENRQNREFLRQRSAETVEAAVTLNTVARETSKISQIQSQPMASAQNQASESVKEGREENGSVEIMHGADLLLWAASTVDPTFASTTSAQQNEGAAASPAPEVRKPKPAKPSPKPRLKLKLPKEPKEPKPPKPATRARVPKTRAPRDRRRKSLIVTLKVPTTPVNGEPGNTGSPPHPSAATETLVTTLFNTPNLLPASPGLSEFTPVNIPMIPTAAIPRPQPYRKPESITPKPVTLKPVMAKLRTSAVDALVAARKQTGQARSVKFKSISGKSNNTPPPGATPPNAGTTTAVAVPAPVQAPVAQTPPSATLSQVVSSSQDIPRPAYAKPGPSRTASSSSAETPDAGPQTPSVPADDPPRFPSQPIDMPLVVSPTARKLFTSFNGSSQAEPAGTPPTDENVSAPNGEDTAATPAESSASVASTEKATEAATGFSKPSRVSTNITRQTTPSLSAPRATLTPEYLETKKITPLVGKGNFLYWEPSIGARQSDVKPLIGDSISSRSPTEGLAASGLAGQTEGRRSYQSPPLQPLSNTVRPSAATPLLPLSDIVRPSAALPLQPLSDTVRPTTAPPLPPLSHSVRPPTAQPLRPLSDTITAPLPPRPPTQFQPPPPQKPKTPTPAPPIKPSDMVFNISRHEHPTQQMVIHGKDILVTATPSSQEQFSWDKLLALLEALKFDDFREILVVNYHYMAEDEDELNAGLGWYRRDNEVIIAKVNGRGRPPPVLVARMKKERKALREEEGGIE